MSDIVFKKVTDELKNKCIIVYQWGKISRPILILNEYQIEELNKEWNIE